MDFCRAAIMPASDVQLFCVIWLQQYFYVYGDDAPNSNEVHLAIQHKKDVYNDYKKEFEVHCCPPRPIVSYKKFVELWNGIYPEVVARPYADVCGKCKICYEIQRIRSSGAERAVQLKAKEAHLLHRGGLFMLERYE